jgi:hypothetical protein
LPEEAAQGRIALVLLLARLDRDREVLPTLEAEAENRVRDVRPHPVHGEEIHRLELAQVESPVVIARGEIGLGAVVEVADVAHGGELAVELHQRQDCDVGCPVALIGRLERRPPTEERDE